MRGREGEREEGRKVGCKEKVSDSRKVSEWRSQRRDLEKERGRERGREGERKEGRKEGCKEEERESGEVNAQRKEREGRVICIYPGHHACAWVVSSQRRRQWETGWRQTHNRPSPGPRGGGWDCPGREGEGEGGREEGEGGREGGREERERERKDRE